MRNSKLIELLSAFSKVEFKRFKAFVDSPYYNTKAELSLFLKHLSTSYPFGTSEQLTKEVLFKKIYPQSSYEDKKMRYLMSDLFKLAEQFLILQRQEQDTAQGKLDLLACYLERNLEKHFLSLKSKVEKELKEKEENTSQWHFKRMQFADLGEQYFQLQRQRRFDSHIQMAADELDQFYYIKKLRYSAGMQDREQFLSTSYRDNTTEQLLEFIAANDFFENELIKAYYSILQSLKEASNPQHFFKLKALLIQQTHGIPILQLREIYLSAINYCARKIRKGENFYLSEALELYQKGIERQVLIDQGQLSPWTFTNVVKLALRLKHFDWIEQFIKKYSQKLPASFRENALNYNLAELYYYRKTYNKALDYLNLVEYSDLNYYLGSRVMLIKIYFEQEEEQVLLSQLAAFTMFLKRNKEISGHLKKTYLNFCSLLFTLLKNNPKQLNQLDEKIKQTSPLTDQGWLLQQLERIS